MRHAFYTLELPTSLAENCRRDSVAEGDGRQNGNINVRKY
jgi:hypothetical protein